MKSETHNHEYGDILSFILSYPHRIFYNFLQQKKGSDSGAHLPKGTIFADPSPLIVRNNKQFDTATQQWNTENINETEIRIGNPDGPLPCRSLSSGAIRTSKWVHDGLTYYLQDVTGRKPLTQEHTLGEVSVEVIVKERVNLAAWNWSQITSKLWLSNVLEDIVNSRKMSDVTIWILGGWYGITAFLALSREKIIINKIRSFDIDPETESIADAVNSLWTRTDKRFKAFIENVNDLDYSSPWLYDSGNPDIVINTSCEHIRELTWFDKIPDGTIVILQSTDMEDEGQHVNRSFSFEEFKSKYPLNKYLYEDTMKLDNDSRFMVAGIK